jgi:hypothetical protein
VADIKLDELLQSRAYEAKDVLPPNWHAKSGETVAEQTARLSAERAESDHRRRKEMILFAAGAVAAGITFLAALWFLFDPRTAPEQRSWAQATLTGLVGLALGSQVNKGPATGPS